MVGWWGGGGVKVMPVYWGRTLEDRTSEEKVVLRNGRAHSY